MLKKYDYNFILYFLYSLILFVIPWKLFLDDNFAYIFSIIARLFSIVLFFIYQKKFFLFENKTKANKYFYFIPFFICCFSNLFLLFFTKDSIEIKNIEFLINDVFLDIFVASSEEILFTYALIMYLETKNLSFFKIIIFSALIFALSHLLNITLDNIFNTLLQCLYCFGIGLITSFMFVSTRNIILSILFHFLFNFFNQSLFEKFIINIPMPIFILVNCSIALLTFIYWLIIYKKRTIL